MEWDENDGEIKKKNVVMYKTTLTMLKLDKSWMQVHSMSQIALKKDHVFIDTVGEEDEETHAKVQMQ